MTIKELTSKSTNPRMTISIWFGNASLEHNSSEETDKDIYSEAIFYDSLTILKQNTNLMNEEVLGYDFIGGTLQIRINEPKTLIDLIGDKLTKGEVLYEVINPNKVNLLNTINIDPKPTLELKDGIYILDYNTEDHYSMHTSSASLVLDHIQCILDPDMEIPVPNPADLNNKVDLMKDLKEDLYQAGYEYKTNGNTSITVPYLNTGEIFIVRNDDTYYVYNANYGDIFAVNGKSATTAILAYINFVIL